MNATGMAPAPSTPEITQQLQLSERLTGELLDQIQLLSERLSGVMMPVHAPEKAGGVASPTITKMGSIMNQNNAQIEAAIRKLDAINSNLAL